MKHLIFASLLLTPWVLAAAPMAPIEQSTPVVSHAGRAEAGSSPVVAEPTTNVAAQDAAADEALIEKDNAQHQKEKKDCDQIEN